MRAKQILSRIPVPAKVKLVYARLTLNRLTTVYFVLAVIHCILQVVLQLAAHAINVNARHLVSQILEQAKLTMDKFALVETKRRSPQPRDSELVLTLCRGIPGQFGLSGKEVCNVLWGQNRGMVNDTLEDFLSPSSEDDDRNQESSSDSDEENHGGNSTTTALPLAPATSSATRSSSSVTLTAVPSTLPIAIVSTPARSTLVVSTTSSFTRTSTSSFTRTSTSSLATSTDSPSPTTTTFRILPTTTSSPPDSPTTSSPARASPTSITAALAIPTAVSNIIKPDSGSSDSNDSDGIDDGPAVAPFRPLRRSKTLKQKRTKIVAEKSGERKLFDREKLRPLSLPPRPRSPASAPLAETSIDIDESRPDLEAHIRRARVAPMTNSLLNRARQGLAVEYVPIAPRAVADPKRFVSSHSKRSKKALSRRTPSAGDAQPLKITPVFALNPESDDDKKNGTGNSPMKSSIAKPRLVSVKITGLLGDSTSAASSNTTLLAEGGLANNTAAFGEVELSPGCALALSWPNQVLRDFAREDLAMIGFQVWLLVMTIVAILNESIPHLIAGLVTQALSTGWSAFQMARSTSFRARYETIIVRGACSGVDVLPDYFSHRTKDEIPIVVFNGVFLIAMAVLSWRMCRVYGWQTFKRIGASVVMNRAYRLVLAFSIHLQVAIFFFVTSSALWVDELLNGSVACFAEHRDIYEGIFITSILLLLPWLILGWIGVRRENKHMMHGFLAIGLLFITAWAAMFASDVYRWIFATWPFFAVMTVVSFVVLVATTGLAIVCRLNFKKGLAQFLRSQQILPGTDFTDAMPDPEKVVFPAQRADGELPTFSVAFGQGGNPQPPSQMFPARPAPTATLNSGYSTNPYTTTSSDFWGTDNVTQSTRTKSSSDVSTWSTTRETAVTTPEAEVPRYSVEDTNPSRRELPTWEEVRRSQLPSAFDLRPQPQVLPQLQVPGDRSSVFSSGTTATGQFEVLRDGEWLRVDARELHRTSVVSGVTHASGFSGASWAPGDDAGPLPARVPVPPVPAYASQYVPPAAPRVIAGLPGKNIRPQKTNSGRVTQQFSPPKNAGVLGGAAVPSGW